MYLFRSFGCFPTVFSHLAPAHQLQKVDGLRPPCLVGHRAVAGCSGWWLETGKTHGFSRVAWNVWKPETHLGVVMELAKKNAGWSSSLVYFMDKAHEGDDDWRPLMTTVGNLSWPADPELEGPRSPIAAKSQFCGSSWSRCWKWKHLETSHFLQAWDVLPRSSEFDGLKVKHRNTVSHIHILSE